MKAIVLADGDAPDRAALDSAWPGWADAVEVVIAADGGARHADGLQLAIDTWVGDGDSITADALVFAAEALDVPLTAADRRRLQDAYLRLGPWPDAADALRSLRSAGVRVTALANFSPAMLEANVRAAGFTDLFDDLVSTDLERTYKPAPAAYQLGVDRLRLRKQDILFVAFGGWDAAGARAFGFPTYWVNRSGQPAEELGVRADRTSRDLAGVLDYVLGHR